MESGRNFRQVLIFCAKDTFLLVLSGLNSELSDEEIKEEMMNVSHQSQQEGRQLR